MPRLHPTACIDNGAVIADDAEIGAYCVIGPGVAIGARCRLHNHVSVAGHTTIGTGTTIYPFASLGTPPQSVKYRGEPTRLVIGADCDIREGVTMNIGTEQDGGVTTVGDRCFFMAGSHVGHDCRVGNDVTFANNAVLGGHVTVGDHVFFGGQAAVHQFVRIGEGAMISGLSGVRGDLLPFGYALGQTAHLVGLNVVGMKRRGYSRGDMHRLRRAYQDLFAGPGTFAERSEQMCRQFADDPVVGKVVAFLRETRTRALTLPKRTRGAVAAEPALAL
jgi:UDP-N-acetylglucosamine acyltransferase